MTATVQAAAWVDGEAVTVEEVEARLAALRTGTFGARLPGPHTAEGRNARRWVVQLLCGERIARAELAARGIAASRPTAPAQLHRALRLGGVAAALLAAIPETAELLDSAQCPVDDDAVCAYYERNHDLFADRGISFVAARSGILADLQAEAADRAFTVWLDGRLASAVVLAHGFEHPAEPGHADSTHRH